MYLSAENIKKNYGMKPLLERRVAVSERGRAAFGLIGVNGTGKSTLLKILAGVGGAGRGLA